MKVQDLMVELGDFVGVGDPVAGVMNLDPLVIEADVGNHISVASSQSICFMVRLRERRSGRSAALRLESLLHQPIPSPLIEIDNSRQLLPAGVSAEATLNLETETLSK
ncbi:hypothetical protein O9929_08030 [Vibrio lentus]|nr:hypothetical protein [Vibrio lentus]